MATTPPRRPPPRPPRVLLLWPARARSAPLAALLQDLTGHPPLTAASPEEALALAAAAPIDAVVAASALAATSTLATLAQIRRETPGCLLIFLADRYTTADYLEASRVDVDGYLLWRELPADGLRCALGAVLVGGAKVISRAARVAFDRTAAATPLHQLVRDVEAITVSPVQAAILDGLTGGLRQGAIAARLRLGRRSVERQIAALRVQYDAPTTALLVERAKVRGYTTTRFTPNPAARNGAS